MSWLVFGDADADEGDGKNESDAAVSVSGLIATRASSVVVLGIGGGSPSWHTDSAVRPYSYLRIEENWLKLG